MLDSAVCIAIGVLLLAAVAGWMLLDLARQWSREWHREMGPSAVHFRRPWYVRLDEWRG